MTATNYIISYENTNTGCFTMTYDDITTSETTVELTGLEEGTEYSIMVTAILSDGITTKDNILATTMASGLFTAVHACSNFRISHILYSSNCCSHICECVSSELHCHHCPVGDGTMYPSQWNYHQLHTLLLSLSLLPPPVLLPVRTTHCGWVLSKHLLLLFSSGY